MPSSSAPQPPTSSSDSSDPDPAAARHVAGARQHDGIDWAAEFPGWDPINYVQASHSHEAARALLADPARFSAFALRRPLRAYQCAPLRAIVHSVVNRHGLEFLLIFPRQSGKNEAVAHLLAYLLNLYRHAGGNIVYGAVGDQLGIGIERLEARLDNPWNRGSWTRAARPIRRCLGKACVLFISAHPSTWARGQTAHHLLVLDEAQEHDPTHIEAVFTPMRASTNATALYIGTVKTSSDYLWTKKAELERETARDGTQRVYMVQPGEVTAEVPAYRDFLQTQIRKHGRNHPIVASEYFLEPIDAAGGLFPERRRRLMRGTHARLAAPQPGDVYVATIDVAGEDEAATDPIAQLARPGRDYTVATLFRVVWPPPSAPGAPATYAPGPTYEAVDVFVDHGSRHFEDHPGRPALCHRLLTWLQSWHVAHVVADESGVGAGLVSWLAAALGSAHVTGYNFAGPGKKANLGAMFLSLIETGRFKYWTTEGADVRAGSPHPGSDVGAGSPRPGADVGAGSPHPGADVGTGSPHPGSDVGAGSPRPGSDAWWFWRQVEACGYELPPSPNGAGRFERDLRWEVPATHRTATPAGTQPTHDDRLLSAALIAELDRAVRACEIVLGRAASAVIPARDPLADMRF